MLAFRKRRTDAFGLLYGPFLVTTVPGSLPRKCTGAGSAVVQRDTPSPDVIDSRERALRVVTAQTQDVGHDV